MSPLLPISAGVSLAGMGLSAIGTEQGARALYKEKARQLDESAAFQRQQQRATGDRVNRLAALSPGAELSSLAGSSFNAQNRAVAPSAAAGAAALGLSPASGLSAVQAMEPSMRMRATGDAGQQRELSQGTQNAELASLLGDIQQRSDRARALWEGREQAAAAKGGGWRAAGSMMQGLGQMGMTAGMMGIGGGAGAPAAAATPGAAAADYTSSQFWTSPNGTYMGTPMANPGAV